MVQATGAPSTSCKAAALFEAPASGGGGDTAVEKHPAEAAAGAAEGAAARGPTIANGPTPRRIPFTIRMQIDEAAERQQIFEEAWRTMKYRFYDPNMNGVNWEGLKDTYESLLPNVVDLDEFHVLVMDMIGKLNSSHTGIGGGTLSPDKPARWACRPAIPGFDLEPDSSGYYKVSYIYQKGPADHDYVRLHVGDLHPGLERQGTENQRQLLGEFQRPHRPEVRFHGEFEAGAGGLLEPFFGAAERRGAGRPPV